MGKLLVFHSLWAKLTCGNAKSCFLAAFTYIVIIIQLKGIPCCRVPSSRKSIFINSVSYPVRVEITYRISIWEIENYATKDTPELGAPQSTEADKQL